jgi:hypothetical protein
LQSTALGYHAHAMSGIEQDKIRAELGIPDDFRIEAAVAIGRKGDPATLPEPLRAREAPSGRQPVAQVAVAGRFSDLPARD